MFYVVQSGGVVLKRDGADEIYMAGDLVDPLSLVTSRASGDVFSIGSTMLMGVGPSEIRELMLSSSEMLSKTLLQVVDCLKKKQGSVKPKADSSLDTLINDIVAGKQRFAARYSPLLFGEKALYRKGVKLLELKDGKAASAVFMDYLKQFRNSPLSRPVKMYLALSELLKKSHEAAAELLVDLLAESPSDMVAGCIYRILGVLGLRDTAIVLLRGLMDYPEGFYNSLPSEPRVISLKFEKDQVVLEEEKVADRIAFVLSGRAGILKKSEDGVFLLDELDHNSSFGELQTLRKARWDVTLVARSDSRVILVSEETFLKIVTDKYPTVGLSLLEYMLNICSDAVISSPG